MALEYARRYPEHVRCVVAIGAPPQHDLAQGPVEITAPVLIAHGRYDYAVAYTGWEEHRHKAPQAQLCAIREQRAFSAARGAGRFDQTLLAWIDELGSSGG